MLYKILGGLLCLPVITLLFFSLLVHPGMNIKLWLFVSLGISGAFELGALGFYLLNK